MMENKTPRPCRDGELAKVFPAGEGGDRMDDFDRKIARFDRRATEILVSILVSLLTSTFVLWCAGVI